jgi:hypothetical protein
MILGSFVIHSYKNKIWGKVVLALAEAFEVALKEEALAIPAPAVESH